jgi:rare lipoprotein A
MLSRSHGSEQSRSAAAPAASAFMSAAVALGMLWPTALATSKLAEAKTPGKSYCYHRVCHRVMTLEETRRAVGRPIMLFASHYDDPWRDRFNPRNLTSSGEMFLSGAPDNAASPKLPNGTIVLAWNPATRQAAVLRINNAGPYWRNRTLDVSRAAAERLGFARQGVARLTITVVQAPTRQEATYRKGRRYAAVPGPIGTFASFELASAAASRAMGRSPAPDTAPASTVAVAAAGAPDAATAAPAQPIAAPALPSPPPLADAVALATRAEAPSSPAPADPPTAAAPMTSDAQPRSRRAAKQPAKRQPAPAVRMAANEQKRGATATQKGRPAAVTESTRARAASPAQNAAPTSAQQTVEQSAARVAQLRRTRPQQDDDDGAPRPAAPAMDNIPVECRSWTYRCTLSPSATAPAPPRASSRTRVATASSSNNE